MCSNGLTVRAKKSGISFYAQTRDGSVFVCFVDESHESLKVWLRTDALSKRFDFGTVADEVRAAVPPQVRVWQSPTWFILTMPSDGDLMDRIADVLLEEIVARIE
jgi:hypothetical protein